jgi:hypothetical protein
MASIIKIKKYLPAIGLCTIIFLWPIQIPVGPADGVPVYIMILIVLYLSTKMNTNMLNRSVLLLFMIFCYTFFQLILQNINLDSHLLTLASIFVLSLLIPLIYELLLNSKNQLHVYFVRFLRFFLSLQLIFMVFQLLCIQIGWLSNRYLHYILPIYRVSGFFNEPSHLALSLSPFYYLIIIHYSSFIKMFKKYSVIILVAILLICPSTTLFAVILASIGIRALCHLSLNPKKIFNFIVSTILGVFLFVSFIKFFPSFSSRVMSIFDYSMGIDIAKIGNISSLVYLKGYQMATYGITHFPLGVGINNMVMLNDYSSISHLSATLYSLNKEDGSSMIFKISSEFGILGLLFYIGSLILLLRYAKNKTNFIEQAFLFAFIISGVRGPTYFDGPLFIGISIYVIYLQNKWNALLYAVIKPKSNKRLVFSIDN